MCTVLDHGARVSYTEGPFASAVVAVGNHTKTLVGPLPQNMVTGCGACTGHNDKPFPHCLNKSQSISSSLSLSFYRRLSRSLWRQLHSVLSPPLIISFFPPCWKLLGRGEAPSILPEGNSDKIRVFFMTKHHWLLIRTVLIDGRTTRVHPCEKSGTSQIFDLDQPFKQVV